MTATSRVNLIREDLIADFVRFDFNHAAVANFRGLSAEALEGRLRSARVSRRMLRDLRDRREINKLREAMVAP